LHAQSGTPPANFENGAVLVVETDKIAQISVASVNLQIRHRPDGLSTDSEIGKRDLSHLMNRELQTADSWLGASSAASLDLDDGKVRGWDQFKVNEQMFDVKTSFDENLYTTRLDKSKITA
jgi:PAB1-binding protein PBP1